MSTLQGIDTKVTLTSHLPSESLEFSKEDRYMCRQCTEWCVIYQSCGITLCRTLNLKMEYLSSDLNSVAH